MLGRYENAEQFALISKGVQFTESEESAAQKGVKDYWDDLSCNPMRHGFAELSKERNHYEAAYEAEVIANG